MKKYKTLQHYKLVAVRKVNKVTLEFLLTVQGNSNDVGA